MKIDTPIVLIIYHKPEITRKVFESIRLVKPKELFIIADGPKNKYDRLACYQTRSVVDLVDWKCKVYTDFSPKNLGLRKRVVTGLNWVFSKVDRAIILEDDLIIEGTFFKFCEEMLEKYKHNERIISISGNNFLFDKLKINKSYFFSHFVYSWGWATWARAWKLYRDDMNDWLIKKNDTEFKEYISKFSNFLYWKTIFNLVFNRKIDSWAYCWSYSAFKSNKLTIVPKVNLVSNIGFGSKATHTVIKSSVMNLPIDNISFPLTHPRVVKGHNVADKIIGQRLYLTPRIIIGLLLRTIKQ